MQSIARGLPEADPELLIAHVTVLAQLTLKSPDAFEQKSDVIMAFLLKQVLMVARPDDPVCSHLYVRVVLSSDLDDYRTRWTPTRNGSRTPLCHRN